MTKTEVQPLADAFFAGRNAYRDGQPETVNPHPHDYELSVEWGRGYRNTRKAARFAATIKARQERKGAA